MLIYGIALPPESEALHTLAPAALWVVLLLAVLLPLADMYGADAGDGMLDQLRLSHLGGIPLCLGKILSRWLVYVCPLALMAPLMLQGLFGMEAIGSMDLVLRQMVAGLLLLALGNVAALLTTGLKQATTGIMAAILLPLYVPALIFGAHQQMAGSFQLLLGMTAILLPAALFFSLLSLRRLTS